MGNSVCSVRDNHCCCSVHNGAGSTASVDQKFDHHGLPHIHIHTYIHTHTQYHTHTRTRTHARTHTHAHTHTHLRAASEGGGGGGGFSSSRPPRDPGCGLTHAGRQLGTRLAQVRVSRGQDPRAARPGSRRPRGPACPSSGPPPGHERASGMSSLFEPWLRITVA
jgi:hypothetical protein